MTETPALIRLETDCGRLSAVVAPEHGAELCGLEWEQDGKHHELLYRGQDFSPTTGWTGRAPILWPAIGRTFAPGSMPTAETFRAAPLGWTVDDASYPMPMHGFARALPWAVEGRTSTRLLLVLSDNDQTRVFYPFGFRLTLDVQIENEALILVHRVEASSSNTADMPFVLGNHATFNTPLIPETSLVDTRVSSNGTSRMMLDFAGRPTGQSTPTNRFARPAPISDIERFDVIALSAAPEPPWSKLETGTLSVHVAHTVSAPDGSPEALMTLWGDPKDGYLSLEAWLGKPNALVTGDGVCRLPPGRHLTWTLTISVKQDEAGRP